MLRSPRLLFATSTLVAVTISGSLTAAPTPSAEVPGNYSELISTDAYGAMWIPDFDGMLASARPMLPPGSGAPASMKELLTTLMSIDPSVKPGKSLIAWATAGPSMGGARPGDPIIHIAISAPGANAQNTHAGHDTTLFFDGDMIIAAQGTNAEWKKPQKGASCRLIPLLPDTPIAMAFDIKNIWTDQGQQIQMLGGFGAMAAQMALMNQSPNADAKEQARMREEQKKIGEVMRSSMAGIFNLLKTMDTMTLGVRMDNPMLGIKADFNFMEAVASGSGVDSALIERLAGGMPIYAAMNAKLTQWATRLEYNLESALMSGLSKKQHAEFDAIIPMAVALADTITGGIAMSIDANDDTIHETIELKVQDSTEFINGLGLLMSQVDQIDMGVNSSNTGENTWKVNFDGQKLASSMNRPEMSDMAHNPLMKNGMTLDVTGKGKFVSAKATMGTGADAKGSDMTRVRDMLKTPRGHDLVLGLAMDMQEVMMTIEKMMAPNANGNKKTATMTPVPMAILGTSNGNTFSISFQSDVAGLMKLSERFPN